MEGVDRSNRELLGFAIVSINGFQDLLLLQSQRRRAGRSLFSNVVTRDYAAAVVSLDFLRNPEAARGVINAWVEMQTRSNIRDLVPQGCLDPLTRLILINAVYFKAQWGYALPTL